jgi:Acetyltransferase (GNAT) domain
VQRDSRRAQTSAHSAQSSGGVGGHRGASETTPRRSVATSGISTRELTAPGALLRVRGVTLVGVLPMHRRRGLLSAALHETTDGTLDALLAGPRLARVVMAPNLWVRLVDVPAAPAARTYTAPLDAVLEVDDAFCPKRRSLQAHRERRR